MPPKTKRTVVSGPVVTDLAPPVVVELPVELPELTVRVPPVPVLFAAGVPFPPLPEEELLLEPGSELEPPSLLPSPLLVLPPGKLDFSALQSTLAESESGSNVVNELLIVLVCILPCVGEHFAEELHHHIVLRFYRNVTDHITN